MLRILTILLLLVLPQKGEGQGGEALKIQAAFTYQFTKFIEWPRKYIEGSKTFDITIVDHPKFEKIFNTSLSQKIPTNMIEILGPNSFNISPLLISLTCNFPYLLLSYDENLILRQKFSVPDRQL